MSQLHAVLDLSQLNLYRPNNYFFLLIRSTSNIPNLAGATIRI